MKAICSLRGDGEHNKVVFVDRRDVGLEMGQEHQRW